jgi:hypothetical protein
MGVLSERYVVLIKSKPDDAAFRRICVRGEFEARSFTVFGFDQKAGPQCGACLLRLAHDLRFLAVCN